MGWIPLFYFFLLFGQNYQFIMKIFLDCDGTIIEHDYPRMGRVNFGCFEIIRKLQDAGHEIVLNTYRSDLKNGVGEALKLLNEMAWMCLRDKSIIAEDFELDTIVATPKKIQPQQWDIETALREDIMFIDDIAPNIPLKSCVMIKGNMVDWDEIDLQFKEFGVY